MIFKNIYLSKNKVKNVVDWFESAWSIAAWHTRRIASEDPRADSSRIPLPCVSASTPNKTRTWVHVIWRGYIHELNTYSKQSFGGKGFWWKVAADAVRGLYIWWDDVCDFLRSGRRKWRGFRPICAQPSAFFLAIKKKRVWKEEVCCWAAGCTEGNAFDSNDPYEYSQLLSR